MCVQGLLVRFFKEYDHLETFRNGDLRMMSAQYYKDLEKSDNDGGMRIDHNENSVFVYNADDDGIIKIEQPIGKEKYDTIKLNKKAGTFSHVCIGNPDLDRVTKIACFTIINRDQLINGKINSVIGDEFNSLGEYFCLVISLDMLLDKIISKAKSINNCTYKLGPVKYVDISKHNGYYGSHKKPDSFCWQKEYRFSLLVNENDPYWFKIDSIKDITVWGYTQALINGSIKENELVVQNIYR